MSVAVVEGVEVAVVADALDPNGPAAVGGDELGATGG